MANVGLVTVLYNSNDVLDEFFASLAAQTYTNYHLYLIDNSPSEATDILIAQLSQKYLNLIFFTHIKNESNYGVARGNNQGIEHSLASGASYVLLLNNDISFSQSYLLEKMLEHAIEHDEQLIVPKIFYHNSRIVWMAGGAFLNRRGYTVHVGENQPDGEAYSKRAYFDYAPTCFMLISKEVFAKIGLMDEKYFVYYDDTDFIIRCLRKNLRVFLMPELEVFHKVAISTGGGESVFSIYYQNRNRIYFIKKNFSFTLQFMALTYTLVTRALRYVLYNKEQRKVLSKAIRDGFTMKY